ncbi:ABC transporter ATP-binding protein [Conexibacter stalactiti]|uniref:ABC transporter ATP-binding protein n=1 Tax=Conexibacter stalactiti TaxID=1940611 RepID=A0ABU4HQ02_9ACTN|nr:ABC transporter ATP-binding protein [Conexibacter stalactiti]MDW5594772.1 ABC transporter ATP-binding protein [Conexibacter stalactiti]MEC5035414.1 ABC transporter ATP-binding protein [Conexibacter stalactiti]
MSEPGPPSATLSPPLLRVEHVVKRFGGVRAVDDASFAVERGSITALIGPNGAGKTTLFNVVTGFQHGDGGTVVYDGRAILGRPPWAIARCGLVRTFQITKALAAMPVIDNMTLAAPHQPGEHIATLLVRPRATRRREHEIEARAGELLETFGLAAKRDDYAGTLSGGQRKLLELARVLMAEPRMVLLDEPMAGVNPTLGGKLLEHVHALRERDGTTFLLIEHDMEVVMGHSDRVVCMAQGAVIAEGAPEAVRNDPRVIDAYLGGGSA